MTGLGAALYGGFFGLAALWLFLTSDAVGRKQDRKYEADGGYDGQAPEVSKAASVASDSDGSSPELVSQAASK